MTDLNYDDIIDLPHHVSQKHTPMNREDRAAQFAPFAALTGHSAAVREEARLTEQKIELTEEWIDELNRKMAYLRQRLGEEPTVSITYFSADSRKAGGAYMTISGEVKYLDDIDGVLVLADKRRIPLRDILTMESEIFSEG